MIADTLFWDDELEALTQDVVDLLGEEAIEAALARARAVAGAHAGASEDAHGAFVAAVKVEFRRLLRPH